MSDTDTTPTKPRVQGMLCPVCKVDLVLSERLGIEIDYCPSCRGVWLDRGELDKIIERNAEYQGTQSRPEATYPVGREQAPSGPWSQHDEPRGYGHGGERHGGNRHSGGHGRRGGFLGGLFDR